MCSGLSGDHYYHHHWSGGVNKTLHHLHPSELMKTSSAVPSCAPVPSGRGKTLRHQCVFSSPCQGHVHSWSDRPRVTGITWSIDYMHMCSDIDLTWKQMRQSRGAVSVTRIVPGVNACVADFTEALMSCRCFHDPEKKEKHTTNVDFTPGNTWLLMNRDYNDNLELLEPQIEVEQERDVYLFHLQVWKKEMCFNVFPFY